MIIRFSRSGGFAGIKISASIDTDQLELDQAKEILELIKDVDLQSISLVDTSEANIPDQFLYEVSIQEKGDQLHTYIFSENQVPDSLWPLVKKLSLIARHSLGDD